MRPGGPIRAPKPFGPRYTIDLLKGRDLVALAGQQAQKAVDRAGGPRRTQRPESRTSTSSQSATISSASWLTMSVGI